MLKYYLLYFAESGRLVGMYSELRKAFGRKPDPLLEITHDVMGDMRLSWQKVEDGLGAPVEHFFRDDIPEPLRDYLRHHQIELPAVVGLEPGGKNRLVCSREDLLVCNGKTALLEAKLRQPVAQSA